MARVDFYILSDRDNPERFACSLISKIWHSGNRVHVHTHDEQLANHIDDLLWIFRDISFIPHEVSDNGNGTTAPISIGYGDSCPEDKQVLLNFGQTIPEFVNRFERIVEIVGGNDINKQFARQRYKEYREQDYDIHDHKIEFSQSHG